MTDFKKISDESLVIEIRNKNKELYSYIISRYQIKLQRYVYYLINDKDKSADIVQNTFIKAYINLNAFNCKKKFSSWIYRIAHNEAMNEVKKHYREKSIEEGMDFESGIDLEDSLIKKELVEKTHKCLEGLAIIYKEPLTLYFLENKSYEEISEILRISIGTVGTRISRAKTYLKKLCQK